MTTRKKDHLDQLIEEFVGGDPKRQASHSTSTCKKGGDYRKRDLSYGASRAQGQKGAGTKVMAHVGQSCGILR